MSVDEIRAQKALALLEYKEAEDTITQIRKEKERLASAFHALGAALNSEAVTTNDLEKYRSTTLDAALDITGKLMAAKKQLAEATAKKTQFGL